MDLDMYAIEALLINEIKDATLTCAGHEWVNVPIASIPGTFKKFCPITTGTAFLNNLGMDEKYLLRDSLVMLGWWLLLLLLTALFIKFLNHQKR